MIEHSVTDFQRTGSDNFADGAERSFAIFSGGTSLSDFGIKVGHLRQKYGSMDSMNHHICKDEARSGRHLAFWDALMGFRDPWIIDSAEILDDFGKVAGNFFKQFFATSPLTML